MQHKAFPVSYNFLKGFLQTFQSCQEIESRFIR